MIHCFNLHETTKGDWASIILAPTLYSKYKVFMSETEIVMIKNEVSLSLDISMKRDFLMQRLDCGMNYFDSIRHMAVRILY